MKKCNKCNNRKSLTDYYRLRGYKDGLHPWCKVCFRVSVRNSYLKRLYGISLDEYNTILEEQGGGCAICGKTQDTFLSVRNKNKMLAVDHDHYTNIVRGILCENCNRGIGLLQHDPDLLLKAIEYLTY